MWTERVPVTEDHIAYCCDEFRSAVDATFAMPVHGPTGWLLYGTDAETVSAGLPELRYWAVRFCPFCGSRLAPYPGVLPRSRAFGFDATGASGNGAARADGEKQ